MKNIFFCFCFLRRLLYNFGACTGTSSCLYCVTMWVLRIGLRLSDLVASALPSEQSHLPGPGVHFSPADFQCSVIAHSVSYIPVALVLLCGEAGSAGCFQLAISTPLSCFVSTFLQQASLGRMLKHGSGSACPSVSSGANQSTWPLVFSAWHQ